MAKKKAKKKQPKPFDVFVDATFSWKTAALLGRNGYKSLAYSLEAFALELHFKCLHELRGRKGSAYGHQIQLSWKGMDKADKKQIKGMLAEKVLNDDLYRVTQRLGYRLDIKTILKRAEDLFVDARYSYEGHLKKKWRVKRGINHGISLLIRVVHDLILNERPKWDIDVGKAIAKLTPSI